MQKSFFHRESPMLTKTAEYALRALLVLARYGDSGRPVSAATIARLTAAPSNYLSKTLLTLARSGLIRSSPGRSGGFELMERPERITVAQVADLFAEPRWTRHCLLGNGLCNPAAPCAAHDRWHELTNAVRAPMSQATLAYLLGSTEWSAENDTDRAGEGLEEPARVG